MNHNYIKYISIFIFAICCVSCIKQNKLTATQTFILSNPTNQSWDLEIAVKWGKTKVTHSDSAIMHIENMQIDSINMFFKLTEQTRLMPISAVYGSSVNDYYIKNEGCWIQSKLTNNTTHYVHEWEQRLSPYIKDTLINDSNLYLWEWMSTSDQSYDQHDRFKCTLH